MENVTIERFDTRNEILTIQPIVEIELRSVNGYTLKYPSNDNAKLFSDLINKPTFSVRDLGNIQDLGFRIELIKL